MSSRDKWHKSAIKTNIGLTGMQVSFFRQEVKRGMEHVPSELQKSDENSNSIWKVVACLEVIHYYK